MIGTTNPQRWMADANCLTQHPELFFPTDNEAEAIKQATSICKGCMVRFECLELALSGREEYGIWGGTTPATRRSLQRTRAA